jgi:thiol-disulfide isomerase/thioredoxin
MSGSDIEIYCVDDFKKFLESSRISKNIIILKFGAEWCKPCNMIKDIIKNQTDNMDKNIHFYNIDIDESIELYVKLKSKKMINGIPSLLAWYPNKRDINNGWYIPDNTVSGVDEKSISNFFSKCNNLQRNI